MKSEEKNETKKAAETLGEMIKAFGATVAEVLEDPEVKEKAKELAKTVVDAATNVAQSKVKNAEVRAKLRNVGKAAQTLGSTLEKNFKSE